MTFAEQFHSRFGRQPTVQVRAPGRINLIGEHIDYLNGWVMPAAIERYLRVAAAPRPGKEVRLWSPRQQAEPAVVNLRDLSKRTASEERWLNYSIGVLQGYAEAGVDLPGFDAVLDSDLPIGAGLSSSAALETATALVVEALSGFSLDVKRRALLCQKAEHQYAGVPCGIMDQLAVGACRAGHATLLDCLDLTLTPVPLPAGAAMLVADTGVKHTLGDGEYRKRRQDCETALEMLGAKSYRDVSLDLVDQHRELLGDRLFRRARHAVTEMRRVHDFVAALQAGNVPELGRLMREGHESLRDDFEVSCPELDCLVAAAYDFGPGRGLIGSRMTGGGFGGSTISVVRQEAAEELKAHLIRAYQAAYGRTPNVFLTAAAAGASLE